MSECAQFHLRNILINQFGNKPNLCHLSHFRCPNLRRKKKTKPIAESSSSTSWKLGQQRIVGELCQTYFVQDCLYRYFVLHRLHVLHIDMFRPNLKHDLYWFNSEIFLLTMLVSKSPNQRVSKKLHIYETVSIVWLYTLIVFVISMDINHSVLQRSANFLPRHTLYSRKLWYLIKIVVCREQINWFFSW